MHAAALFFSEPSATASSSRSATSAQANAAVPFAQVFAQTQAEQTQEAAPTQGAEVVVPETSGSVVIADAAAEGHESSAAVLIPGAVLAEPVTPGDETDLATFTVSTPAPAPGVSASDVATPPVPEGQPASDTASDVEDTAAISEDELPQAPVDVEKTVFHSLNDLRMLLFHQELQANHSEPVPSETPSESEVPPETEMANAASTSGVSFGGAGFFLTPQVHPNVQASAPWGLAHGVPSLAPGTQQGTTLSGFVIPETSVPEGTQWGNMLTPSVAPTQDVLTPVAESLQKSVPLALPGETEVLDALQTLSDEMVQVLPETKAASSFRSLALPMSLPQAAQELDKRFQVFRQLEERLILLRQQNQRELQIQLEPAQLGKLKLRLQQEGALFHLQIVAETPAVKELLDAQMQQLRQQFAAQGFSLDRVEVDVQSQFSGEGSASQDTGAGYTPMKTLLPVAAFSLFETAEEPLPYLHYGSALPGFYYHQVNYLA